VSDLVHELAFLHFLRPYWLAVIPVALWLWSRGRPCVKSAPQHAATIAPHLADAMTVSAHERPTMRALDVAIATLILISIGAAGPSWNRVPSPFVAQTAPLAVALAVTESMLDTDIQPTRLERARQKIRELTVNRAGARTALIAYAGTAHRVVPLTEDPAVLRPFIDSLAPPIMPQPGRNATAALELATKTLAADPAPGAILFVVDALDPADVAALEREAAKDEARIVILAMSGAPSALKLLEQINGIAVVRVTPGDGDIEAIERRVTAAYRESLAGDDRLQWADQAWLLAWPAALLSLLWFRRGSSVRWCVLIGAAILGGQPGVAEADGITDWFLTPDQQGRALYNKKAYPEAAATFEDPLWRGYALLDAGAYEQAAAVYSRLPSAEGAFAAGVAYVKGRAYRDGIAAFERALQRDPSHAAAAHNLGVARAIVAHLERAREAADTEEGSEGADDVVFDNDAKTGYEVAIEGQLQEKIQTAEQWMRTVDTRTADFLRLRFQLEAAANTP